MKSIYNVRCLASQGMSVYCGSANLHGQNFYISFEWSLKSESARCLSRRGWRSSDTHRVDISGQHRPPADQPVSGEPGTVLPHIPGHVQAAEGLEAPDSHPAHHVQRLRAELPLRGVHQSKDT